VRPSVGAVTLGNAPPDTKNSPPEGLHWGAGDAVRPAKPARAAAPEPGGSSPEIRGVFTESVVAELPSLEPAPLLDPEPEEEHELFVPEQPRPQLRGRPREPGEPLPAGALSPVGFDGPRVRPPG
jgi:hypothetical protein